MLIFLNKLKSVAMSFFQPYSISNKLSEIYATDQDLLEFIFIAQIRDFRVEKICGELTLLSNN